MTETDPIRESADPAPEQEPSPEALRRRQQAQEEAELEALAGAGTEAETLIHERRADKARYLREKLEAQRRADHG